MSRIAHGLRVGGRLASVGDGGAESMERVHLRFVRPGMKVARAVTGPDGAVIVGVGSALGPALGRLLEAHGVASVWVDAPDGVAPWERDPELDEALRALEARFGASAAEPTLGQLYACLRERLLAHAARRDGAR